MKLREALKSMGVSRMTFKPGDVCLAEDTKVVIPETPEDERKFHENGRPCVVLSNREICQRPMFPIVSIAPVSHLVHLKDSCDFPISPTPQNGLHVEGLIMLGHIQPIRKVDIFKVIGSLSD